MDQSNEINEDSETREKEVDQSNEIDSNFETRGKVKDQSNEFDKDGETTETEIDQSNEINTDCETREEEMDQSIEIDTNNETRGKVMMDQSNEINTDCETREEEIDQSIEIDTNNETREKVMDQSNEINTSSETREEEMDQSIEIDTNNETREKEMDQSNEIDTNSETREKEMDQVVPIEMSSRSSSSANNTMDLTSESSSPSKSRYGRSHKPKSSGDFLSHDKKLSAAMRVSDYFLMENYHFSKDKKKARKRFRPSSAPMDADDVPSTSGTNDAHEIDDELKDKWKTGDLVFARIGKHPYWPAIITPDPERQSRNHLYVGGRSKLKIHVQFFADNCRRSWVSSTCIIPFCGFAGFFELQDENEKKMTKSGFKKSGFRINNETLSWWTNAVSDAEDIENKTREERLNFVTVENLRDLSKIKTPQSEKQRSSNNMMQTEKGAATPCSSKKRHLEDDDDDNKKTEKQRHLNNAAQSEKGAASPCSSKKRPLEDDSDNKTPVKQKKIDKAGVISSSEREKSPPLRTIADRKKRQASLLEIARSNAVDPTKQPTVMLKKIKIGKYAPKLAKEKGMKQKKKARAVEFKIYCSKMYQITKDNAPDLPDREIYKILCSRWKKLSDAQQSRFKKRSACPIENPFDFDMDSVSGESLVNEDIVETSKNSNEPSTSTATRSTVIRKLPSLFYGVKAEKACSICEEPGDTVRCRGICNGVYHIKCLNEKQSNPNFKGFNRQEESCVVKKKGRKMKSSISKNEDSPSTVPQSPAKVDNNSKDSDSSEDSEDFRCYNCVKDKSPVCFACNTNLEQEAHSSSSAAPNKLYRCHAARCGKFYHKQCLERWPQSVWGPPRRHEVHDDIKLLTCPQHCCHTCVSDNPTANQARYANDKIVRCIRCPSSYHYGNYCIPAGSEIITQTQIVCPLHYEIKKKTGSSHINAAWCFICASGGSLICCDQCPTAFHADCLNISPPEGSYICEDCQTGRYPLFGEIVWVKLGAYRWWPAQIQYPFQIPLNILNLKHTTGEFVVQFFGSHDYFWVNRGRVFLLQENDNASKSGKKSSVDTIYNKAVEEALAAYQVFREEKAARDAGVRPGMKPPPYIKIKTNKPVGSVKYDFNSSSVPACECKADSENPCAQDSDCLNRLLSVECDPLICPAGERCNNQMFEKRLYHHVTPFPTDARGWGLKTVENIKKGEFIIEYVGEMIDEAEYKRRLEQKNENYYFLVLDKDHFLDAGPKGNMSRFMNHSCQPNCETQKWTVGGCTRVGLFALEDITSGTELVFNYNLEAFGNQKKPCLCNAPNCSGFIGSKASKQTSSDDEKKSKPGKKKVMRLWTAKYSDDECFICCEGGDLINCDNKKCTKAYHNTCLDKPKKNQGFWVCPWHHCSVCNKKKVQRCSLCVNSYCTDHATGNIILDEQRGLLCIDHQLTKQSSTSSSSNSIEY